ncbi:MAG TPA: SpoIIE family protein phosphatase [Verrucomicrobiae bacterium]|nr:SpoIIE family protein phosphatase [Verrucomicrobiae bacterium]
MQLGIRSKFIGILIVAAILPLWMGVIVVWVFSYDHYRAEKGVFFESLAIHFAQNLNQVVDKQVEELDDWLTLSDLHERIRTRNMALPNLTDAEFAEHIQKMEARWPALDVTAPELRDVLRNNIARELDIFQSLHPLFAEILVTDIKGQLAAATGKTSDYWQADEEWWQRGMRVAPRHVYIEGVTYDQSAKVYSIDVAVPIRDRARPDIPPVGVAKGILNISPLFSTIQPILSDRRPRRQLIDPKGYIVFDLFHPEVTPFSQRVNPEVIKRIALNRVGWTIEKLSGDDTRMIGFTALKLTSPLMDKNVPFDVSPLYVVVHDDAAAVLSPVRAQLRILSATGVLVIMGFALAGLYIANRRIIAPIQRLRTAAQLVARSAKLEKPEVLSSAQDSVGVSPASSNALEAVRRIRTADEIERLAQDFLTMAQRVLRYHEQLEAELTLKTEEIQRDLQVAREFQEALMPRVYPQIPPPNVPDPFRLTFHHVYKPASTVGGDFFDVLKLSDHRVAILIADVMGHGARSALVTAILRTLLQDLVKQTDDPAKLLAMLNERFHGVVAHAGYFIFVSAFYMIVDAEKGVATYASAGHPPPLLMERARRAVRPLIHRLRDNPALGVAPDSHYTRFASFIADGDTFVFYTDGIVEALSAAGEEFGIERLCQVLAENIDAHVKCVTQRIVDSVNEFTGSSPIFDDICVVGVEIAASPCGLPSPTTEVTASR